MEKFTYIENKKRRSIKVKVCNTILKKTVGLMFGKKALPLLFIFGKEKNLSIHSFFCKSFVAIWLDKNKKVTKKVTITKWLPNISGKGKYLLEIPIK